MNGPAADVLHPPSILVSLLRKNRNMSWKSIQAIRIAVTIVAVSACLASSKTSYALPMSLTQTQFNTAAGGSAVVEDFEGFSIGVKSEPFVFANGRYSTPTFTPAVINLPVFGPTKRLLTNDAAGDLRTFDLFPTGTTLVGLDLFYIDPPDTFDIVVTGGSGILNISQTGSSLGTFLGFQDLLGISSITFLNQGQVSSTGNYSFDNIQTASGSNVPEPTSMALFGLTALGLGFAARRRRRKGNPTAADSPA